MYERGAGRLPEPQRERLLPDRSPDRRVVRAYVTVNLVLAARGRACFTWLVLEIRGFDLAIPLAVLVAFLDLIPLSG